MELSICAVGSESESKTICMLDFLNSETIEVRVTKVRIIYGLERPRISTFTLVYRISMELCT